MKCTICSKPIVLSPSATERAEKFGGNPNDYTSLFTEHSKCIINKRTKDTESLIQRINEQRNAEKVSSPFTHQH